MTHFRSSHQKCSMQIGVLRNFTKFIGKHLCQSFFFNKVPGLRPAILLKKRLWHRYFPMNFVRFLTTPFLLTPLVVASIVWKMKGVTKFSDFRKQPSRGVLRKKFLKICRKFTGEHLCRSVISIKLLCNAKQLYWNRTSA